MEYFQEVDRYRTDLDRLQTLHINASEVASDLDTQKRQLREDLKELKNREQRLLNDYSELEEENISLQKQVSVLFIVFVMFSSASFLYCFSVLTRFFSCQICAVHK